MPKFALDTLHKALGVPLAALTLAAGGLAVAGCGDSKQCQSPRTESLSYPGDPNATSDRTTWQLGILATLPRPAADVIVGFRNPNDPQGTWHDSHPVPQAQADKIVLKLGNGAARFSEYYEASSGSPVCNSKPAATFSPAPLSFDAIQTGAAQPVWP